MSFSISVKDGDIELEGNTFATVSGTDKLVQDLSVWLKERFNSDRFHPSYGSTLDYYIGSIMGQNSVYEIQSEVSRVLSNYQALQLRRFREAPQNFDPSEILAEVNKVEARSDYDKVLVSVHFTTYNKVASSLDVSIGD